MSQAYLILVRLVINDSCLDNHQYEDVTACALTTELFCWLHFIGKLIVIFSRELRRRERERRESFAARYLVEY